jgi:TP901 family phage tail tape measure protein
MAGKVVSYTFRGDIGDLKAKLAAAGQSVGKLADDLTKADAQSSKWRKGLVAVGDSARNTGLVAAAGLGAIVAVSSKFDQAMSNVQAATGETAANMDRLRQAALDAGAATAFSASEAAQGIEELSKAGVSTTDILNGGLAGALDLAAAGGIEVGEAAEYAAKAMTMFELEGSKVPHVANLLSSAAGKAVGEVGDFGAALNQVGLVAAQTGLSIEDTVGTLAAFAQAGLQGSDAGTAMKASLQRLQNPLGLGAKALETYGIAAYDTQGNFVGITDIAGQLQEKLGGLDQATRDAAMSQIFGSDAVRAATVLYNEGADGIQEWIDQTNDAGYAAETAATRLDNLRGDFEALTGSIETFLITSGEGSDGFFRSMVQGATDGVNALNELPPVAKNTATAMLGITAVTGGALWFGSRVIQSVANTRAALADLGLQAGITRGMLLRGAAGMAGLAVANSELAESTGVSNTAAYGLMGTMAGPWGAALGVAVGATMDLAAANDDLEAAMDAASAAMDTGDVDAMREAIAALKREMGEFSINPADDMWARLRVAGLEQEIREIEAGVGDLSNVFGSALAPQLGYTAEAFGVAGASAEEFAASLEQVDAVLGGRASLRDYQAALDAFTDGLLDNGKAHGIATDAGRANNENLDAIAKTALRVAENFEGMDRIDFLDRARGQFLAAAKDMEIPRKKALQLADDLGLLDKKDPRINVTENGSKEAGAKIDDVQGKADKLGQTDSIVDLLANDQANPFIDLVRGNLTALDGDRATVTITTQHQEFWSSAMKPKQSASGGTVAPSSAQGPVGPWLTGVPNGTPAPTPAPAREEVSA